MTKETTFIKKKKNGVRPHQAPRGCILPVHWVPDTGQLNPPEILSKVNHTQAGETPGIIAHVIYITLRLGQDNCTRASQHTMGLYPTLTSFSCFDYTQRTKGFLF